MVTGSEALRPGGGKLVFQDNIIKFDKVPLITPNGDVLIKELSFEVCIFLFSKLIRWDTNERVCKSICKYTRGDRCFLAPT